MFLVKWVPFINHSGEKSKREGREGEREGGGETSTFVSIIMDSWLRLGLGSGSVDQRTEAVPRSLSKVFCFTAVFPEVAKV